MSSNSAFIPFLALPPRSRTLHRVPLCSASTPSRRRPARPLSLVAAVMLAAFSPTLPVHAKELRYDGRQELDSREKAMSLTLTTGTFAALSVWAWKQNRRDDELEEIRIKEEVERLEKLKAEFMDVDDDDSIDDEELLASLRERIGEDEGDSTDTVATEDPDAEDGAGDVDMLKRMWEATDEDEEKKKT